MPSGAGVAGTMGRPKQVWFGPRNSSIIHCSVVILLGAIRGNGAASEDCSSHRWVAQALVHTNATIQNGFIHRAISCSKIPQSQGGSCGFLYERVRLIGQGTRTVLGAGPKKVTTPKPSNAQGPAVPPTAKRQGSRVVPSIVTATSAATATGRAACSTAWSCCATASMCGAHRRNQSPPTGPRMICTRLQGDGALS